jgi:photosystem II stability/assembly factor-like uncharacterized protein
MLRFILALSVLSFTLSAGDRSSRYAVYRSEDHGRSWSRSDTGLPGESRINAFSATRESIIAGADSGIFTSTDSGKTWKKSSIVGSLTNSAHRITSVAAVNNSAFAGTSDGAVLVSADNGQVWTLNQAFPRRIVRSLLALDGGVYVGTDAAGVYKTTDLGRTWIQLAAGLPENAQVLALTAIDGHLFAGLYARGLYTLDQPDQRWVQVGTAAQIKPLVLASKGETLVAGHNPGGIYWSDDLGQTWKHWTIATAPGPTSGDLFPSLDSILGERSTLTLEPLQAPIWEMTANPKIAIAGAGNGIYLSTDHARTWTRATNGLHSNAPGIAFLIRDGLIFAAVHERSSSCTEVKTK